MFINPISFNYQGIKTTNNVKKQNFGESPALTMASPTTNEQRIDFYMKNPRILKKANIYAISHKDGSKWTVVKFNEKRGKIYLKNEAAKQITVTKEELIDNYNVIAKPKMTDIASHPKYHKYPASTGQKLDIIENGDSDFYVTLDKKANDASSVKPESLSKSNPIKGGTIMTHVNLGKDCSYKNWKKAFVYLNAFNPAEHESGVVTVYMKDLLGRVKPKQVEEVIYKGDKNKKTNPDKMFVKFKGESKLIPFQKMVDKSEKIRFWDTSEVF